MTPLCVFLVCEILASMNVLLYMVVIIKRGLRALGDCKFLMPSNTVGIAGMRKELSIEVVKTMPPRKKI